MRPTLNGLAHLSGSSFAKAVDVMTWAFWDDPLNEYFFPDEDLRKRYLPLFFEYRLKQGRKYGEVFVTSDNVEGVAIWRYSKTIDSTLWREFRSGGFKLLRIYGRTLLNRMLKVNEFTINRREKYAISPFLHLGPIAVDPEMQSQGYGSKLIRPMLTYLDETKMHCYLEAQNESNVSLYEHYDFEVLAKGVVPNTDIPHWDMMRSPQ
ncbi:MAG: GNAT family N-acetyltransferase [Candidatus Thorarchaeota archaeon]